MLDWRRVLRWRVMVSCVCLRLILILWCLVLVRCRIFIILILWLFCSLICCSRESLRLFMVIC